MKKRKKVIVGFVVLYLAFVSLFTYLWLMKNLPWMDLPTIVFQMKVPLEGTEMGSFLGIILLDTVAALAAAGVATGLFYVLWKRSEKKRLAKMETASIEATEEQKKPNADKWYVGSAVVLFLICFGILIIHMDLFKYVYFQVVKTKIYEERYVDPEQVAIAFPEKKRNLIYLYLESMELSFTDKAHGGIAADNYLPGLTELSLTETDFAYGNDTKLNGITSTTATTWTIASLVAQTSGIPLSIPIGRNAMGKGYTTFLPGAYSLGNILEKEGYKQMMVMGSDGHFSGMDVYLTSHGGYEILDYYAARDQKRLPSNDYYVWWGYEDLYLFQFAKEELVKLAEGDQPFALTLMTMDTHRTGGYECKLCKHTFGNQYSDVIACSDQQVMEFIGWLKEQDFYENTTVVIVGDHPTMDGDYVQKLPGYKDKYQRRQYLAILNGAVSYTLEKTRKMTPMDLFPTTLAALGATIPGDRLGLGTNLYSETPTLLEEMGLEKLNKELSKNSVFYDHKLLYGEEK